MDKKNPNTELLNFFFNPENETEETLNEHFAETGYNIEAEEIKFMNLLREKILSVRAEETRKLNEMYLEGSFCRCIEENIEAAIAFRESRLKPEEEQKILERDKEKLAKLKEIKKKRDDINGDSPSA